MAFVVQEKRGQTLVLTLNDPVSRNAVGTLMRNELIAALDSANANAAIRVIVVIGADDTFCSGGDLGAMPPSDEADAVNRLKRVELMIRLLTESPKATIAVVDGFAVGLGASLACACDYVFVTEQGRFLFPFTRLGLMPDGGVVHSLAARTGHAKARQVLLEGQTIAADEAVRIGLADSVFPRNEINGAVLTKAEMLAERAPLAVSALKSICAGGPADLDHVFGAEQRAQPVLYFSDDFAEGKAASKERRTAVFTGS
ncbi:enoyl-CoA hydratase/isomerase family protein [Cryobacterium sp. PH29-G1]|uniref:enoyl-CoA hydratase/isomerase family protein n=1 Tax=Cryobacterium sp. PH29-G1 TaxID=3046211 RepID=UPI0024B8C6A3|nr:enoyl-CoA hydratase/isomerase family protein [Cryobacterium sp. PH29-G1]MDJ0350741.1 enoyl-CoA hydratase/isomerase family protein [Cryobacterium sp. PH29-G1]